MHTSERRAITYVTAQVKKPRQVLKVIVGAHFCVEVSYFISEGPITGQCSMDFYIDAKGEFDDVNANDFFGFSTFFFADCFGVTDNTDTELFV